MAANVTATRTSTLFADHDNDGQFDPGEIIVTRVRITVGPGDDALAVTVGATTNGITVSEVQVTPIAFDDFLPSITGNTPMTFTAAQLLGNDVDPDQVTIGPVISGVGSASNGAIVNNGDGTFTFTPTTGYVGTASFQYTITDEDGLASVSTGIVSFNVTDPVWYVNAATGSDITGDGSWAKPFATLAPINTGGSADALDNANDTIFVYNAGTYANASIVLESGQKLFGDGHAFSVNGLNIGANASNTTLGHSGVAVTLADNNRIEGLDLVGTAVGAIGISDGGVDAGTLTVANVAISGQGRIIDIDHGGTLAVTLNSASSTGSVDSADNSGAIDLHIVNGTFTVTGATSITGGSHTGGGIDITGSTALTVNLLGNVAVSTGANTAINFSGNAGASQLNMSGAVKDIDTTGGTALNLTNNNTIGGGIISITGGGLDVDTGTGKGIVFTGGGTLNITGANNTVNTVQGAILDLQNGTMGVNGIQFATLGASGNVLGSSGTALNINNLDAAGAGTFSGGDVTIGGTQGAGLDGINITSSNSTFSFASATIDNTTGDGIEINGATQTQGAVTFTTVNIDGVAGAGVSIVGATNAVNINGGTIGATNDPAEDAVRITNGTGAVTIAASVTKTTLGNEVVDVSGHSTGAISFTGAIASNSGGGGIRLVNNSSGNIGFSGDVTLNTGTLNALNFTNTGATGANVTFTEGSLDIDTTSGTGINATSSIVGAGSLTISGATGAGNIVTSTTGRAINIDGVTANITLDEVNAGGGGTTAVFLKNTGSGGQFVVTGTGSTAGSGGTIANISGGDLGLDGNARPSLAATTGTGIYMENVSNVSLSNMTFSGTFSNFGIRGENVTNFTLRDSTLTGTFGTNEGQDEGVIRFGTENSTTSGVKGTALFEGNNIAGGFENNLSVFLYGNDSLNMTVKDSANDQAVFGLNSNLLGDDSLHVESGGTGSNLTLTVDGVAFNGARGDQLQTLAIGVTTQNLTITNNQFLNGHGNVVSGGGGVDLLGGSTASDSNANITFNFSNNTIKGAQGDALNAIYTGYAATINGVIFNNQIGTNNGTLDVNANGGSINGGEGINVGHAKSSGGGSINFAVRIESNDIYDIKNGLAAIRLVANSAGGGTSRLEATVKDNINGDVVGSDTASGLYAIVGGQGSTDPSIMGLSVTGNTFRGGTANGGGNAIWLDQNSINTVAHYNIPGYNNAGTAARGEFRSGGTASASLSAFWSGTNSLTNGAFPIQPGKVDASNVFGITNGAFSLAVPMMAAQEQAVGWEDLAVSPVTAPPRDPEPAAAPDAPGESAGGDMGNGGRTDTGGSTAPGTGSDNGGTPPAPSASTSLTQADLAAMIEAAIQRWIDAGASAAQVDAMRSVEFGIVDMAGMFVGSSTAGVVDIDNDAAGRGWFVDSTPGEDSEFEGSGTRLTADSGGAAEGRIDLLTVLMHELGHQIGLGDEYAGSDSSDLMYGYVNAGERRLPAAGEAAGATPGSVGSTSYAIAPVNIGTIPDGKTVDVLIKGTINAQTDNFIVNLVNSATVSGSNFDPQVAQETIVLDGLTLGNMVFLDLNKNGIYDSGTESGIVGVVVDLYADTNDSGGWDGGDAFLGTRTTAAGGLYSFAGLAPGDYVVVVKSTNFDSGGALAGKLVSPGAVADPDATNQDGDNNGIAAAGGAVAAQTITLAYNTEPTNGTGNDTNNSVDFGFVENAPPVANDDSSLTATEDQASQYSTELTGNDTDPDSGDTLTIVSAGNATNGSVSVTGGVVTFTPTANFNGTATFEYTIDDGHGHQDTAVATVTVAAVNDPVVAAVPATVTLREDSVDHAVTGMSISDVDSALAPSGVYVVTLSATQGSLKLTTTTGLTFSAGDGDGDSTMTFRGTLADVNSALATAKYSPNSNYNGSAQITLQATDEFGAAVATGTGAATSDSEIVAVTVSPVNDAPQGTDDSAGVIEGLPYTFLPTDFSDGFSDPIDGNGFAGVKITELPLVGTLKLDGTAILAGATITLAQLTDGDFTYESPAGSAGSSPTFKFAVQDNGGNAQGGIEYDETPNVFTLNIAPADIAPIIDLDADDSSGTTGSGFDSAYTEGGAAAAVGDSDVIIGDMDSGDNVEGATITIANAVAGDVLTIVGALPGSITVDPTSTETNLILTGTGTQAQYAAAIEQITFSNTGNDPTAGGTNTSRTINVTVTDGDLPSNVAVTTISVADDNADAPSGTDKTIIANEDAFRLLKVEDLGFVDSDGTFASVTISGVTGGGIYYDADGSAGSGDPVLETLPKTYTAQDLADGKVSFKAAPNAFGAALGTITFAVTDDDGNTDGSPNTLTVDVHDVNDAPVLDTSDGDTAYSEDGAPVAIDPNVTVSDIDGPVVAGQVQITGGSSAGDLLTFINDDAAAFGDIAIEVGSSATVLNLRSSSATATFEQWENALRAITFSTTSDNPSTTTRTISFIVNDGTNFSTYENKNVTVTATNDAPTLDLNGAAAGSDATLAFSEGNGITRIAPDATVSDPDSADFAGGTLVADLTKVGTGDFLAIVDGNGITVDYGTQKVFFNSVEIATYAITNLSGTFTFTFKAAADSAAVQALVRQVSFGNQNDNQLSGDRTVSYTLSDGDGGTASVVTATVSVTAVNDGPVAQPDAVSTPENAIGTGSLFVDNDSGPDSDAEGDPITISEVNGSSANVGQEIVLASGAKLTVNADGTYSYDPNGKFDRLTDNSSGAVNTSTVGDTFQYTVTGGNTVTVTVTVNGVAGPGDWLMGDGGDNTITGTPQADTFVVSQGGNDTVNGLASNDIFYFGGALTAADNVTGGEGSDTIVLQGDYSGGLTLDASVTGIERISMLAGSNVNFGDPGTNLYDYDITTHDSNFAAGVQARINGASLLAGEDFRFDGSAETDAKFVIYGGRGQDDLTGGAGNDIFFFHEGGHFAAGDVVDGGGGYDGLFLRGNYTIDFTQAGYAGALTGLENLTVSGASDERYGRGGGTEFDYSIVWDDDLLGSGQSMTINGSTLGSEESLAFNGSDESDGRFSLFGGAGNDVLTGGDGADLIYGGLRGDTLTGGAGNDVFRYNSVLESNSTERDGIQDFNSGDLIDLSKIDANILVDGDQAFSFIGNAAFSNTAGELRFENISLGGPVWLVQGDTDGNGVSDFEVVLVISPPDPITSGDFIL